MSVVGGSGYPEVCQGARDRNREARLVRVSTHVSLALDRDALRGAPPTRSILNRLATLRQEPMSDDDSTADEGVSTWVRLRKERQWK